MDSRIEGREPEEVVYAEAISSISSCEPGASINRLPSVQWEEHTLIPHLVLVEHLPIDSLEQSFEVCIPAHCFGICECTLIRPPRGVIAATKSLSNHLTTYHPSKLTVSALPHRTERHRQTQPSETPCSSALLPHRSCLGSMTIQLGYHLS